MNTDKSKLFEDAYIRGLPIIAMYRYTVSMAESIGGYNQIYHNRDFFKPGVLPGGANRDTLYSSAGFTGQPVLVEK